MKYLYTTLLAATLLVCNANAQSQTVSTTPNDHYDRASLSIVLINHNDGYDRQVTNYFNDVEWGDKFDHNLIKTKTITSLTPRNYDRLVDTDRTVLVRQDIESNPMCKEVISYIYCRKSDGMMSDEIIRKRGRYNAIDQDVISSQATKIGTSALADYGFELVKKSYILFIDYTNIKVEVKDGKTTYNGEPEAYLYQIKYNEEIQAQLFDSWIYAEDSEEVKQNKRAMFDRIPFGMVFLTKTSTLASYTESEGGLSALVIDSYESILYNLENKVDDMKVKASVSAVKPIRAKIGMKEGLRNTARYNSYKYKLLEDGTTIVPVKTGVVRATKIADNRIDADGNSSTSQFYQIAGISSVKEGEVLKQKNDIGVGISLGYQLFGLPGFYVGVDKLLTINTSGLATYLFLDGTFNSYSPESIFGSNAAFGFGLGYHFARIFEIQPQISVGCDVLSHSNQSKDLKFEDYSAVSVAFGAKLYCNIAYPLQAFVGINYSVTFGEGEIYKYYKNNALKNHNRAGMGINFGLKVIL